MGDAEMITEKIHDIQIEMKNSGIWKNFSPTWVSHYETKQIITEPDFCDWLQFIYLPNLLQQPRANGRQQVVPQAMQFFGEDVKKGRLLQLLIELDSLS